MDPREVIFLVSSVLTLATGVLIVLINPWRPINRTSLIAAMLSALWLFSIFMSMRLGYRPPPKDQQAILFWLRMTSAFAAFLPWSYFLIKESILRTGSLVEILWRSVPWAVISCGLALVAFSDAFIHSESDTEQHRRGFGYIVYLAALALMCIFILYGALRALPKCRGIARIEIKFFAINFCLATLAVLLMFFLNTALKIQMLRYLGALVVVFSFSLTIWAICYHRVFDATQILLSAGQRLLLLGLLGISAVGLAALVEPIIPSPYGIFLTTMAACLLTLFLDRPTKKWLGLDTTRRLQQSRQIIIDWVRRESDEGKLTAHFERYLAQWCQADQAILLDSQGTHFGGHGRTLPANWPGLEILGKEGWITPEALHRQRKLPGTDACLDLLSQHGLGALLAVPRGSPTPSLLVALGQKDSLRPYTYPDIQQLLELAELMDNILTHSRVAARTAQIEKMESAAMMSHGLAHDLNNLATPVASFLLHMEPRVQAGTPEAEVLHDAKHAVRVMQDYIRESLFFTRQLAPDFRTAAARELMESVLTLTQARATARGVTVAVSAPPDIHFVADSALIRRLLQNLVFNGIDATARGGVVTLSAAVDTDSVRFSVTDEGAGIPPAIMDRIFEPYFTTKDTGDNIRGLGLGLAICRKICDLHGGDIKVSSAPGRGSTFTVVLPIEPRPSPARDAKPAVAGVNPARRVVPQTPAVRSATS